MKYNSFKKVFSLFSRLLILWPYGVVDIFLVKCELPVSAQAYMYVGLVVRTRCSRVPCQAHFSFAQSPSVTGQFVSTHAVTWSEQAQVNPRHRSTRCRVTYISTAQPLQSLAALFYRSEGQSTRVASVLQRAYSTSRSALYSPQFAYNSVNAATIDYSCIFIK